MLFQSCFPPEEFADRGRRVSRCRSTSWRRTSALEGDLDAARELDATVESAELFLYPGDRHLFTDESLPEYDEAARRWSSGA